jgi:predicted RNA-binding protein with PIN domain
MSTRLFCVDGTNLVRTANGYGGPAHQAQESADTDQLVEIFARLCEDSSQAIEVEIFFDGPFRRVPLVQAENLRISFTRELTADDMILDRVRAHAWKAGRSVTVVTADGDLGRAAQSEDGK